MASKTHFKIAIKSIFLLLWKANIHAHAYSSSTGGTLFPRRENPSFHSRTMAARQQDDHSSADMPSSSLATSFDAILLNRYACTRFQRSDGIVDTVQDPSPSDPVVVQNALQCLNLARRAPSGFNAQPYKLLLVQSPEQKKALARYCIGHNAHRVRDSDCTAIFLADRETARTLNAYRSFVIANNAKWNDRTWGLLKIQALITLFSSGYPLPRFLGVPISFAVRLAVSCVSVLTFRKVLVPTLSSAETWSTKNAMLVAMAYMLACTSRGLTTCPMEGFNAGGIRKALQIPRRYSIPIIVSTGRAYVRPEAIAATATDTSDDMGMTHGSPAEGSKNSTPRYDVHDCVYQDTFGDSNVSLLTAQ